MDTAEYMKESPSLYMTASGRSGRPLSPQALHILNVQQSSDHTTTPVHCFRFGGAFTPGIGPEDRAEFRCENNRRSERLSGSDVRCRTSCQIASSFSRLLALQRQGRREGNCRR